MNFELFGGRADSLEFTVAPLTRPHRVMGHLHRARGWQGCLVGVVKQTGLEWPGDAVGGCEIEIRPCSQTFLHTGHHSLDTPTRRVGLEEAG